ncbi:MAG: acetoin utilization protein AcuC [Magnetococcus sp. WYHC-3]
MRDAAVGVFLGRALADYAFGVDHPFGPRREDAFVQEATRQGLLARVRLLAPAEADVDALLTFHSRAYVQRVQRHSYDGYGFLDAGDTPAFPGVYEAAAAVVGSALEAAERIMDGSLRRAFVPIAGLHHAQRASAGGFCVFNDAAVVYERLRCVHGLARVAYVDIDAHHGDGVFYPYQEDPALIFADLHEDGRFLYPGTGGAEERGQGSAVGRKLNIPLPPRADDRVFFRAWPAVEALLETYPPDFIIVQCGADCLSGDPITHLEFSSAVHAHAISRLCAVAEARGHGRVLCLGGGGYNLDNIGKAWSAVLQKLLESPVSGG